MWDYAFRTYTLPNMPPSIPTITGPLNGTAGDPYTYTFTSTDPEDDDTIFWNTEQASGTPLTGTHIWLTQNTYQIEATARDEYWCKSDWATFTVSMPKNRAINILFLNFLQKYPIIYQILQGFLKL